MTNHIYQFPAKIIKEIIAEETESKFANIRKHDKSYPFSMGDEMREMCSQHKRRILALSSYEEIDKWLGEFRRMSLREWVDSL